MPVTPVLKDTQQIVGDTNAAAASPSTSPSTNDKPVGNSYVHDAQGAESHEEITKAMKNSFLVDEDWRVEAIVEVGAPHIQKNFKNELWYFGVDGKYKHVLEDKRVEKGVYKFDEDKMNIELITSTADFSHSEYHLRLGGSMMIWTGTSTYGNNSVMIKMVRVIRDRSKDLH